MLIMERSPLLPKMCSGWISYLSVEFLQAVIIDSNVPTTPKTHYSLSTITCHCLLFRKRDLS
jgi:hypothetical protein